MEEEQAEKKTLIADIRRLVQQLLDNYLTIGPFSSSEAMQNDGKKSENAEERQNKRNALKNQGKKNGANARNRTEDLFITSEPLYRLSYVGIRWNTNLARNRAKIKAESTFF